MAQTQSIAREQEILGGTPVFAHTRVPVQTLLDYLAAGQRLDDFFADFPTVTREQATAVFELLKHFILTQPYEHEALR